MSMRTIRWVYSFFRLIWWWKSVKCNIEVAQSAIPITSTACLKSICTQRERVTNVQPIRGSLLIEHLELSCVPWKGLMVLSAHTFETEWTAANKMHFVWAQVTADRKNMIESNIYLFLPAHPKLTNQHEHVFIFRPGSD